MGGFRLRRRKLRYRFRCVAHFPSQLPIAGRNRGVCEGCGENHPLTKHHVFPRRVLPSNNGKIALLCVRCHFELETLIAEREAEVMRSNLYVYADALSDFKGRQNGNKGRLPRRAAFLEDP